jgi:hypothetical protein
LLSGEDAALLNQSATRDIVQAALLAIATRAVQEVDFNRTGAPTLFITGVTFPVRLVAGMGGVRPSGWSSAAATRAIAAQFGFLASSVALGNASWGGAPALSAQGTRRHRRYQHRRSRHLAAAASDGNVAGDGSPPPACDGSAADVALLVSVTLSPPNVSLASARAIRATVARVGNATAATLLPQLNLAGIAATCVALGPSEQLAVLTFTVQVPLVITPNPLAPRVRTEAAIAAILDAILADSLESGLAADDGLVLDAEWLSASPVTVYAPPPLSPPPSPPPSPPSPPVPPAPPDAPPGPGEPPGPPPAPAGSFVQKLQYGQEGALTQTLFGVIIACAITFVLICTGIGCALHRVFGAQWAAARAEREAEKERERERALAAGLDPNAAPAAGLSGAMGELLHGKIPDMHIDSGMMAHVFEEVEGRLGKVADEALETVGASSHSITTAGRAASSRQLSRARSMPSSSWAGAAALAEAGRHTEESEGEGGGRHGAPASVADSARSGRRGGRPRHERSGGGEEDDEARRLRRQRSRRRSRRIPDNDYDG